MFDAFIIGKEPFFLPFKSGKRLRVCECITRFFKRKLGVHLTITRIRAINTTTAKSAKEQGVITEYEKNCIHRTLGHSPETAEKWYSPKDRYVQRLILDRFFVITFGIISYYSRLDAEMATAAMWKMSSHSRIDQQTLSSNDQQSCSSAQHLSQQQSCSSAQHLSQQQSCSSAQHLSQQQSCSSAENLSTQQSCSSAQYLSPVFQLQTTFVVRVFITTTKVYQYFFNE